MDRRDGSLGTACRRCRNCDIAAGGATRPTPRRLPKEVSQVEKSPPYERISGATVVSIEEGGEDNEA